MPLLLAATVAAVALLLLSSAAGASPPTRDELTDAAAARGLQDRLRSSRPGVTALRGKVSGRQAELLVAPGGRARLSLTVPTHGPAGAGERANRALPGLGSRPFDTCYQVRGVPAEIVRALPPETRRRLVRIAGSRRAHLVVVPGRLEVEVDRADQLAPDELVSFLVAVATSLDRALRTSGAASPGADPLPAMRALALLAVASDDQRPHDDRVTLAALRAEMALCPRAIAGHLLGTLADRAAERPEVDALLTGLASTPNRLTIRALHLLAEPGRTAAAIALATCGPLPMEAALAAAMTLRDAIDPVPTSALSALLEHEDELVVATAARAAASVGEPPAAALLEATAARPGLSLNTRDRLQGAAAVVRARARRQRPVAPAGLVTPAAPTDHLG